MSKDPSSAELRISELERRLEIAERLYDQIAAAMRNARLDIADLGPYEPLSSNECLKREQTGD